MYDIPSNNKIMYLRAHASQGISAANQLEVELQEASGGIYERTSTVLVIVEVTDVGTGGTLTLIAQDSNLADTFDADFATMAAITEAGLYYFILKGCRNSLRLNATVATDSVSWGAIAIGFNAERRPVVQTDGTELTPTYGTGR